MSPGQILSEQMSPWQFASVKEGPRNLALKFGQNWVSNSWDISDMDKCHLDKCCLDKCHPDIWNQFLMFPGTYLLSFIKIGSLTAEIFLIWTNFTWTNVILTFRICSRYSQEPTFKVWLKSSQQQPRYSWYGQMSPGHMLPGQMSPWQLASVNPVWAGGGRSAHPFTNS